MATNTGYRIAVPGLAGEGIDLGPGEVLYVLGANGSGKSTLLHGIYAVQFAEQKEVVRVAAHRQTWMSESTIALTGRDAKGAGERSKAWGNQPASRHKEQNPAERVNKVLYDLFLAENELNKDIAVSLRAGDVEKATKAAEKLSPVAQLNGLLQRRGFSVSVGLNRDQFVTRRDGASYPADQMSDAERACFLLAGEVLTSPVGSLILLDEPEIHLHPSISSPLVRDLLTLRQDCAFVVFTHDLSLPGQGGLTLVLHSCHFNAGTTAPVFEAVLLRKGEDLPESIRVAVSGARARVLFIEGERNSRDVALYQVLFPDIAVYPVGGCQDVRKNVIAIRSLTGLVWLSAFGIADNDGLGDSEIKELEARGVYCLPCADVESLYYCAEARAAVAIGGDACIQRAISAGLAKITERAAALAQKSAKQRTRREMFQKLPRSQEFSDEMDPIAIDPSRHIKEATKDLGSLLNAGSIDVILERFSVKDGEVRLAMARALGYGSTSEYEAAVVRAASASGTLRASLLSRLGPIATAMEAGETLAVAPNG